MNGQLLWQLSVVWGKGMESAAIILRSDNKFLMEDPYQHSWHHQLATQLLE